MRKAPTTQKRGWAIVVPIRRAAIAVSCSALLFACQSSAPSAPSAASPEAHALARTIGETMGRCWFASGETAFAGYIYSPEPNAVVPRVLIVRKDQPAERPVLVVEATGASTVSSYGPLLNTPNAARINSDLNRWATGNTSCS